MNKPVMLHNEGSNQKQSKYDLLAYSKIRRDCINREIDCPID